MTMERLNFDLRRDSRYKGLQLKADMDVLVMGYQSVLV